VNFASSHFSFSNFKSDNRFRPVIVVLLSLIYLITYYSVFSLIRIPIVAAIGFVMIIPTTWIWGIRYGFLLLALNVLWTTIVLLILPSSPSPFSIEAAIGITLQTITISLIGFIRSFHKKMKREIEERIKAENKLLAYQNQLEQTIKERTEALEHAYFSIYQNEKMQAVGQLAGGIAHDFNNKMTIILGYCDLLMKKFDKNNPHYKFLEEIKSCGLQSSELTRQLLAFAQKGVNRFDTVDVNELISDVITLITRGFPKNVETIQLLNASEPLIVGGVPQLQNAIFNIALNAKDAMPDGGKLTIETANVVIDTEFTNKNNVSCPPGPYISIMLSDTGKGITPEIMKHLFEPFFTTKRDGKGKGMGLAAVYGIVESHKGFITVNSVINEGSTFTIYIPATTKKSKITDPVHSRNRLNGTHILVIDDEARVAELFKNVLENSGYRVTTAFGGEEGIAIYKNEFNTFDLVLIDMIMPSLSGRDTFLKLKEVNPSIVAILVTAVAECEDIDLALSEGFSGFIQKPCNRNELHNSIQRALRTKKQVHCQV
jgi:signal transduction histidine kinase/ActR/RegA family two-component response regulator